MTGYDLSRQWFDFAFENTEKVSGNHTALYWWSIELNNRLGWVKKFGIPTDMAMSACGIRSYKTYSKIFDDLVDWGFFEVFQRSKNQYTSNVIALVFFTEALPTQCRSIDQSITNAVPTHSSGTVSINKPETKETYKPINLKTDDANRVDDFEEYQVEDKKEKTPSKVPPKVSPSVHARMKDIILQLNEGYYWTAKDGKALKTIITKITFRLQAKNKSDPTDEQIVSSFEWMMKELPEWYQDKWDTCTIESKFESIVKQIIEGHNGKSKSKVGNGNNSGPINTDRFSKVLERINERSQERRQRQDS